jgi:uncharacterized protein YaaQ
VNGSISALAPLSGSELAVILLVAIVQSEDVFNLSRRLLEQGFRLTQINAFGGFLGTGSVVLLLGVDRERVPVALETIAATCQARTDFANAAPWLGAVGMTPGTMLAPMEVLVGGAVVFGLPVQRFLQVPLPSGALLTPADAASQDERRVKMSQSQCPNSAPQCPSPTQAPQPNLWLLSYTTRMPTRWSTPCWRPGTA